MGEEQTGSIRTQEALKPDGVFLGSQFPVVPLDLRGIWGDFSSFYVEVGFGNGEFLVHLAKKFPDAGFLGIEWSLKSVEKAHRRILREGIGERVKLVFEDARVAVPLLLPPGSVRGFYFNFPDPWFKRRHRKHRLLSRNMLRGIYEKLEPGGFVEVATDWAEYAYWVIDEVRASGLFEFAYPFPHFVNFIPARFHTKYARLHHLQHGDPVFYIRFEKKCFK